MRVIAREAMSTNRVNLRMVQADGETANRAAHEGCPICTGRLTWLQGPRCQLSDRKQMSSPM